MSLKRKYSDTRVSEPTRTVTKDSTTKPLKKAKRDSKDSSLSSTSNPEIFSAESKSANTACSPESSTAKSSSADIDLESDLDSDSGSSEISTSSSDDRSDNESSGDLYEASSRESFEDLESSSEEDTGQSDTSSNISIETDDDPEKVITLRPGKKPKMKPPSTKKRDSLLKRLQAFLPELQNANQVLEQDRIEGRLGQRRMENVEEGEKRVIEMDLGLGVLENKNGGHGTSSNNDDVVDAEAEVDILGRLMGREPKAFSIDEVE
jgi:hypothetical protein